MAASAHPGHEDELVVPASRIGACLERGVEGVHDRAELVVTDADEQCAPAMRSTLLQPAAADAGKVGGVERHQHALLATRKLEQIFVGTAVEAALLRDGENVVAALAKGCANPACGGVRVEQQTHARQSTAMTSAWGCSARNSASARRLSAMKASTSSGKRS